MAYNIPKRDCRHNSLIQKISVVSLHFNGLRWAFIILLSLLALNIPVPVLAGSLDLDWNIHPNPPIHGCENSKETASPCAGQFFSLPINRGSFLDAGGSVQQNQRAQILIGGEWYWHLITGDPATGFAQEVLIQTHQAPGSARGALSASAGNVPGTFGGHANGLDPLAGISSINVTDTGTGTGHPRRVIMRQKNVDVDGEMTMDFRKGIAADGTFQSFDAKPTITQTIANSELTLQVTIDMSGLDYSTMDTAAPVINTLVFTDPLQEAANFDVSIDAQISTLTAGRYIFVEGGPQNNALEGLYFYEGGGGYDVWGQSGLSFRNDDENFGPYVIP